MGIVQSLLRGLTHLGIRVVSNAGGVNPHACVIALREAAAEQGVDLSVAMVTGDEFIDKVYTCRCMKVLICTQRISSRPAPKCLLLYRICGLKLFSPS